MALEALADAVLANLSSLWVEVSFLLCFALGFAFLRIDVSRGPRKQKLAEEPQVRAFDPRLRKKVEDEAGASDPAALLKVWHAGKAAAPTPSDLLKPVVLALLETSPDAAVKAEVLGHMARHPVALANARAAHAVLDCVARAGRAALMEELWEAFQGKLRIAPTTQMYEMLLGGFAVVGDEAKVLGVFEQLRTARLKPTARGYSLTIKGFLKNGMVDAVQKQLLDMGQQGIHIPPFAVMQFFRIACEANRGLEVFNAIEGKLGLPPEASALLLEDCAKRGDLDFARRVEKIARDAKQPLLGGAYDALLKLYAVAGDPYVLELFEEMQKSGMRISEGLCVGLLARCAESKFLRFAEEVVRFARSRGSMSIALYSALMKVYAYSGMYDKACDLYGQLCEEGLEPDAMMYGCLMKFAVECGRTQLSQELSERAPALDIQNYMSLIRAAGRDKDIGRAFKVLGKLRDSGVALDVAAYNCVLDVCVSTGDMPRARALIEEMKGAGSLDVITYNTLMKGYCAAGDLSSARDVLTEMKQAGHVPNDVSYNCIVNAAVSSANGNFREAWETIELMERNGVAVDHYTISIMMKAMKRVKNPKDVAKVLSLMDRSGINVCSDEILLNTVLETCIRHREHRRLEGVLATYATCSLRPSVHTYGSLIKACSTLRNVPRCWDFWHEMQEQRGMDPNDIVLGCMLDALVCNSCIEDAVQLLGKWKSKVPPNTVIYSTIIKGFANTHQADRAMSYWREMRKECVKMNTVAYNAVIDAQARVGNMDTVSELIEAMEPDGCEPDVITYSTIVKGYCVKGDLDKAFEVFHSMQKNNMAGDAIIYNTVLDGCTRHGRMDLADKLLADMERYKIIPSNFTLGILVKMWGRRKNLDKAFEAIETLPRRFGFTPNAQVWTCLMCACLNNGAVEHAFKVFADLSSHGTGPDAKAYGALISGCVRNGELERAISLVDEAFGIAPGFKGPVAGRALETDVLEQLFRALMQRGLMESQGVQLLERLRMAKAPINGRLFTSMFSGDTPRVDGQRGSGSSHSSGGHRGSGSSGCTGAAAGRAGGGARRSRR
mmetsp:Transcript_50540/g.156405  ORF Transcript_50540/g.156405 Transcript_50540/m.156405 type:complete len:1063 (-) Transcript_50540:142-3330(-)